MMGIRELPSVAICGCHDRHDRSSFTDRLTAKLHICGCDPGRVLAWRLETPKLFNGRDDHLRIIAEILQRFRAAEQRQHAIPDQVGGRLLPANHGHDGVSHDLIVGQPAAADLGRHQGADHVIAWSTSLLLHLVRDVCPKIGKAFEDLIHAVGILLEIPE